MKSILRALVILICLPSYGALRVTIDPGHGGREKGAVHGGVVESQLALQISHKLYDLLKKDKNFVAQMIRRDETELTLEKRVEMSKQFKSDLFISIHANANPNKRAKGAEFYIQNQLPMDKEALFLAHNEYSKETPESAKPMGDIDSIIYDLKKTNRILKSYQVSSYLRKNWSVKKRKMIRQGPFYVLSQNEVPSVLIEVGYLSNPEERTKLTQNSYQQKLVKKIHLALKDYAKNMDKLPSGILQPQNAKTR